MMKKQLTKRNRTQEEINSDEASLMFEIAELRKDRHDNCDLNDCQECCPKW